MKKMPIQLAVVALMGFGGMAGANSSSLVLPMATSMHGQIVADEEAAVNPDESRQQATEHDDQNVVGGEEGSDNTTVDQDAEKNQQTDEDNDVNQEIDNSNGDVDYE